MVYRVFSYEDDIAVFYRVVPPASVIVYCVDISSSEHLACRIGGCLLAFVTPLHSSIY